MAGKNTSKKAPLETLAETEILIASLTDGLPAADRRRIRGMVMRAFGHEPTTPTVRIWRPGDLWVRVPRQEVIELLRSDVPLKPIHRAYIADLVEGKIRRRVGRPRRQGDPVMSRAEEAAIAARSYQVAWKLEHDKTHGARGAAVAWAAKEWNLKEETVSNALSRGRRK